MLAKGESSLHRQRDTEFRKARQLLVPSVLISVAVSSIARAAIFHCPGGDVPCIVAGL